MSELTDLRRHAAALTSVLPAGPLEIHDLDVEPHNSPTSAIEARLISPSASALVLTRLPRRLLPAADRYLKFKLADVGLDTSASGAASVARWICSYVLLSITVEVAERRHVSYCVPVTARRSDDGWVARALIRPETWSNAASVTVVSISLAGRPLSKGLQVPATLQVGYNHAPAPAGAVLAAAEAGDVPALQAALVAGGSTEEADYVRGGANEEYNGERGYLTPPPPAIACIHSKPLRREDGLPLSVLPIMVTWRPFAPS